MSEPITISIKSIGAVSTGFLLDSIGIEPSQLVWGLVGAFILQSFVHVEDTKLRAIAKLLASGLLAAGVSTPLSHIAVAAMGSLATVEFESITRFIALVVGASAQQLVLMIGVVYTRLVNRWVPAEKATTETHNHYYERKNDE